MKVVGAIDVGSNAIRMSCARLTEDRRIEYIDSVRTSIRLGQDVFKSGFISEKIQKDLISAFDIYHQILKQNECEDICAYATSAFRESKNHEDVAQLIYKETGIELEKISGGKEARLLQSAVQRFIDLEKGSYMMADLGGGSVEISIIVDGRIQFAESFRLGTVRLLQMFPYEPENEKSFAKWLKSFVQEFLKFLKPVIKKHNIEHLILTGGNAKAIGQLAKQLNCEKSEFKRSLSIIHKEDFQQIRRELFDRTLEERMEELELAVDRADVILPATCVFDQLMKLSQCKVLMIPDVGLREGILREMLESYLPAPQASGYQQIIQSAYYYAKKYKANLQHAQTVCKLSIQIFDAMARLHQYTLKERILLEVAAILHDIGRFIRPSNHHKHSMYLIQNMELVGMTNSELKLVSLIARFHSRSLPSDKNVDYAKLSKKDQKLVNCLTAILKIADALDREHESLINSVTLHYDDQRILLTLDNHQELQLTQWALESKKLLFEETFGKPLEITSQNDWM